MKTKTVLAISILLMSLLVTTLNVSIVKAEDFDYVAVYKYSGYITYSFQRKGFYDSEAGLHYIFWATTSYINYANWSESSCYYTGDKQDVTEGNLIVNGYGYRFSLWWNNASRQVSIVVWNYSADGLYFLRGNVSTSAYISWYTYQTVLSPVANIQYQYPSICLDSNGIPYITYTRYNSTENTAYPYVVNATSSAGTTWNTPVQLSTVNDTSWMTSVVPLTNGKVYIVYSRTGATIKGRLWNGTSLSAEQTVTTSNIQDGAYFSVVSHNDNVHLVFLSQTNYNIQYVKYSNNAWSSEVTVQANVTSTSAPTISKDEVEGLYCFWAGSPTANYIYYKKNPDGTWDTSPTSRQPHAKPYVANDYLTSFYEMNNGKVCLLYIEYDGIEYYSLLCDLVYITYNANLKVVDANSNVILSGATVYINNGTEYSQAVSSGWANYTGITPQNITVKVKYQDVWVNGTFTLIMNNNKTVDIICSVYSLTVYVTDVNNAEKSGAELTLTRSDGYNYTADGLSPVTAVYYNSTHARYVWSQLANQTSSYTVTASLGGQSASASTNLTENSEITITLPAGTTSPGGPSGPGGITLYFNITFKIVNLQNISLPNVYVEVVESDTNLTVWMGYTNAYGETPPITLQYKTYIIRYSSENVTKEETVTPSEDKQYTLELPIEVSAIPPTVQNYLPYVVIGLIALIIMFSAVSVKVESSKKRSSKYKNIHRKWNSRKTVKDLRKRWEKSW